MSGNTPELALKTAVDADDNADYLTIALASSLTTLDALFSNTTGHTHSGAHQGGPVGAISGGAIADGSITSAKIQDGTIATADLANASVTNAKLASDTARANLLTNGGFEIWQRGAGPFTAGAYGADRWFNSPAGTDTFSVSRDTTNVDASSAAAAAVTFTLGTGAGTSYYLQLIEGINQLKGKTLSLSVRVRVATANACRLGIYDSVSGWRNGTFHTGDGTYQTLTFSAAIPATATTLYIAVNFAASCTAYLDNAMLVVGNVAADYAPLHPADDLARCLRYYETWGFATQAIYVRQGASDTALHAAPFAFSVKKAVTPTVTKVGTWTASNCGQPSFDMPSLGNARLGCAPTAAGVYSFFTVDATTGLTAEANP